MSKKLKLNLLSSLPNLLSFLSTSSSPLFILFSIILLNSNFIIETNSLSIKLSSDQNSTISSTQSSNLSTNYNQGSIVTGIVILSLTILLICFFFVVFFHYRLIRKLPDNEMGSSMTSIQSSNSIKLSVKTNEIKNEKHVSIIEPSISNDLNYDLKTTKFSNIEFLDDKTDSILESIDNLSEFENSQTDLLIEDFDDSDLHNEHYSDLIKNTDNLYAKKRNFSCENFVVKIDSNDFLMNVSNNLRYLNCKNDIILNVMNFNNLHRQMILNEKSCV